MENEELILQIKAGKNVTKNMEQLYLQNQNFIYGIAKRYTASAEIEDLMQEAYFGLIKAVEKFDPERGSNFLSYLPYCLQNSFRRYIERNGYTKKFPAHMIERISKYKKYLSEQQAAGVVPSDYAICRDLELSEQQLKNLRKAIREAECISTSDLLPGSDSLTVEDSIADPSDMEEQVIDGIAKEWADNLIWKIVSELEEREAAIIIGKYKESATLKELAEQFNLSCERIRRLEIKGLAILRKQQKMRDIADIYGYVNAYKRTGLQAFKNNGASSVELAAIRHIEGEERIQKLKQSVEQTRNEIKDSLNINELFEQVLNLASQ